MLAADSLLIDQHAASLAPGADDVRAWAAGRRVFVSSLISDMPAERAAAREAIRTIGATPVMFEDLGAQDITAEQAYLSGVSSSEIYVGLWGPRYGIRMGDGYSATHAEYLAAERQGLRLCLFVHGESSGHMDGPQRDLVAGVQNLYTTSNWSDVSDLKRRIEERLLGLAAEELTPWIRVGRTVFRAQEIRTDGQAIAIVATVRSNAVHAELVRLRDSHTSDLPFASPSDARTVRVAGLTTRQVTTAAHEETIQLVASDRTQNFMRMSVNNMSADDVAERALSDGLFGTATLGDAAFMVRASDPLAPVRGLNLDDVALRPVARLLIAEHLLGEGVASTVDGFALGPDHIGRRRLRVAWTPPPRYSNQPAAASRAIDGEVTGL